MRQEIKTEKFEGILVKVPDEVKNMSIHIDCILSYWSTTNDEAVASRLPDGEWKLIGNPFELSEEECKKLSVRSDRFPDLELYIDHTEESTRWAYLLKTAKESFNSLLNSLQVYKENPYGQKPDLISVPLAWDSTSLQGDIDMWQQAEERTGNWILIQKIG